MEHLVVRSDDGESSNQYIDERHVLPPKIDIETGFWYGLLSRLSEEDSFDYNTRANCPFADKEAYDTYINEIDETGKSKGNKCAQCGKSYCGGTQMEKFYSDRHIYPNHYFTDPSIIGFRIRFFWNEQCSDDKEIHLNEIGTVKFGGDPGLEPKSYLLRVKGASEEAFVTVGTIFEQSHIPLRTWFAAIYLITAHKKGISSVQLGKDLNISQKTAWFLLHRTREMLRNKKPVMLTNNVEVDETYIGGVEGNRHANKKKVPKYRNLTANERKVLIKEGKIADIRYDKIAVIGLVERNGKVVAKRITGNKAADIIPIIEKHVTKGSTMLTDEYHAYRDLTLKGYTHKTISHNLKIYVQGEIHTNTIENFWSVLKRGLYGIYHFTSKKHLDRYLDEFCARYNTRELTGAERFEKFLQDAESRLSWKELVNKVA